MYFLPDKSSISKDYTGGKVELIYIKAPFLFITQQQAQTSTIKFEKIDKKSAFLWAQKGFLLYSTVKLPEIHHLIL